MTQFPATNTLTRDIPPVANTPKEKEKLHLWLMQKLGESERSSSETLWREESNEDYQMYAGKQDTDEVIAELNAKNRAATVYNEIKPKIDVLVGLAAQLREEPEPIPVTMEDEPLAEIMVGAIKQTTLSTSTASNREPSKAPPPSTIRLVMFRPARYFINFFKSTMLSAEGSSTTVAPAFL